MARNESVGLALIAHDCKSACAGEPNLEKRIRKAMKEVAKGHWMFPHDDDLCFRGALGGVLLAEETTQEEKDRITASLQSVRAMSAILSGVPVDAGRLLDQMKDGPELLPLLPMWNEAKAQP